MRGKLLLLAGVVLLGAAAFFILVNENPAERASEMKEKTAWVQMEKEQSVSAEKEAENDREFFSCNKLDETVKSRIYGKSYKENRYVAFDDLRHIKVRYYGFDGKVKDGELIVNQAIAEDIIEIFYDLYCHKYPLQEVSLIDKYDADDERSMAANNTSCFNYRVIAGSDRLSNHAYGLAIDINPRINPCITGSHAEAEKDTVYAQRDEEKCRGKYRKYMIHKGDYIYRLFQKHGFTWGGDWNSPRDYQHFEKKI